MSTNVRNRRDNGQPKGCAGGRKIPGRGQKLVMGEAPENHWRDEDDEEYRNIALK